MRICIHEGDYGRLLEMWALDESAPNWYSSEEWERSVCLTLKESLKLQICWYLTYRVQRWADRMETQLFNRYDMKP